MGGGSFSGGTPLKVGGGFYGGGQQDLSQVYDQMFSGGTPLKQGRDPRWQFPMKKPGVPNDPNTDWYGYPMSGINASTQFPPPQNFFGQGTKML